MSHFYRLRTVNDYSDDPRIARKDFYCPSGKTGGLPPEFRRGMQEIQLDPAWPHCAMLRAPATPPGYETVWVFRLQPGVALPDIWAEGAHALVSERARAVLTACDDFEHEYLETEIQNEQRQRINEVPYYLLNVRRLLRIDELGGTIRNEYQMFCPDNLEKKFLPVVQERQALKEPVSQLPLWRHFKNLSVIYLSEATLSALRAANITGLDPYTSYDGKPGEALARFE